MAGPSSRTSERRPSPFANILKERGLRLGRAPTADQSRGNDLRVIYDENVASAQIARQVKHAGVLKHARANGQHAGGVARADRRLRDQVVRQFEIEIG